MMKTNSQSYNIRQFLVMGVKGRRVHMIEEMSDTIISFQRGLTAVCYFNSNC